LSREQLLVSDVASLREVWQDEPFYFGNVAKLQALLQRLRADPREMAVAQMRAERRARWFSAERMVDSYEALYRELLAQRGEEASVWGARCAWNWPSLNDGSNYS
jgi:glycosyltransferase involved in cell wall biosynthesis